MAKEKFVRTKPHMNVGTMGHIDHGKTTLTAAITKYCAMVGGGDFRAFDTIDNAPEEKSHSAPVREAAVIFLRSCASAAGPKHRPMLAVS